jgi:hypothetical protein
VQAASETLTGTFHALMHQSIEEGATVVAERGAAVAVQPELVLVPGILRTEKCHLRD